MIGADPSRSDQVIAPRPNAKRPEALCPGPPAGPVLTPVYRGPAYLVARPFRVAVDAIGPANAIAAQPPALFRPGEHDPTVDRAVGPLGLMLDLRLGCAPRPMADHVIPAHAVAVGAVGRHDPGAQAGPVVERPPEPVSKGPHPLIKIMARFAAPEIFPAHRPPPSQGIPWLSSIARSSPLIRRA